MSELFPNASRLGFGCASLGSRVGAQAGLNALAAAFDYGINWFDLAPAYGDGQAELLFASFARSRRDRIHICTKCGIAPPRITGLAAVLRPMARAAVARFPGLRRIAARGRAEPQRLALTAGLIRSGLDASLQRLGTDYVDVFVLHDPSIGDIGRDDVLRALDDAIRSGKARSVGVAGDFEAARAVLDLGLGWAHLQFPDSPGADELYRLRAEFASRLEKSYIVTHSIFAGLGERLTAGNSSELVAALNRAGYQMPLEDSLRAAALDRAFLNNPRGTVLLSMFAPRHLDFTVSRLRTGAKGNPRALTKLLAPGYDSTPADPTL